MLWCWRPSSSSAFAIALAPLVREVIGVEIVPELVEEGRKRAPANVELVEADATALPYGRGSFDLVCTARTLHHVPRPELALAEMNRLLRPGGTILVADQLAPVDSLAAIELNRFERARDPSTTRILADVDLRGLFGANSLVLRHAEIIRESATSNATSIWPPATATSASARGRWRPTARAPRSAGTSSANPASLVALPSDERGSQARRLVVGDRRDPEPLTEIGEGVRGIELVDSRSSSVDQGPVDNDLRQLRGQFGRPHLEDLGRADGDRLVGGDEPLDLRQPLLPRRHGCHRDLAGVARELEGVREHVRDRLGVEGGEHPPIPLEEPILGRPAMHVVRAPTRGRRRKAYC